MQLAKLTITPLGKSKLAPFTVLFNPASYSISKSVTWEEPGAKGALKSRSNVKFTLKERAGNREMPPPTCRISWGEDRSQNLDFPFVGVLQSLKQDFTLFDSSGRPLRANLDLTFREILSPEEDQRRNDPEFSTRLVKRGDTLSSIDAEMLD